MAIPPVGLAIAAPLLLPMPYPWSMALGLLSAALAIAPLAYQFRRGTLDPWSPFTWATWYFFVPAYSMGGMLAALNFTPGWVAARLPDPAANFALTQVYLMAGIVALGAGYLSPLGTRAAARISAALPRWDWTPRAALVPGLIVLGAGVGLTRFAFDLGLIGFQGNFSGGRWEGLVYFFALSWMLGDVLLWSVVLRPSSIQPWIKVTLGLVLVALVPFHMLLAASRATPLNHVIAFAIAFAYSGRAIRPRHVIAFGLLFVSSLTAGVLFATTFRLQKTRDAIAAPPPAPPPPAPVPAPPSAPSPSASPSRPAPSTPSAPRPAPAAPPPMPRVSPGETKVTLQAQQDVAARATATIVNRPVAANAAFVLRNVGERLEHVGTVSVIVANVDRLRDEEQRRGLSNNIVRWTLASFVPRAVWPNKPIIGDARSYAELYLGFAGSSPAITPVSDLLRNFGALGVVVGMFGLGMLMRLIHRVLVGDPAAVNLGRLVLYYGLIVRLNLEGFFGTLIPDLTRAGIAAAAACIAVDLWIRLAGWFSRR